MINSYSDDIDINIEHKESDNDHNNDKYDKNGHIHGHRTSQSYHTQSKYTHHEPRESQKDMEDKLAQLYLNPKIVNIKKSKSQNTLNLRSTTPNYKMNRKLHSISGPQPMGPRKKKRTFKLAEPTELTETKSHEIISITNNNGNKSTKKKSRNFMKEMIGMRSSSYSPTPSSPRYDDTSSATPSPPPPLSTHSLSANGYNNNRGSNNHNNNNNERVNIRRNGNKIRKKKRNSFKLGDDSQLKLFRSHNNLDSYKTKYNVHKPKIKPGSNQFLVSQKMRELQNKLKQNEENENKDNNNNNSEEYNIDNIDSITMNEMNESLGKELYVLQTIKLPNYSSAIPRILIELKKKLYICEGLKQRKIFHISVKNNTSTHHQIAHLLRNFFNKLPKRLLDCISIIYFKQLLSFKQIPDIISIIPEPNKSILLWLWDLLSDTIEYSYLNKMNTDSLSKSFASSMITNNININVKLIIKFFKFGIQWRLFLRQQNDNLY